MRYKALTDCHIFGEYRPAGSEFEGPPLEGYDLKTASHLEVLGETPPKGKSKTKADNNTNTDDL